MKKFGTLSFVFLLGLVLAGQVSGQAKFGPKTEPYLKIFSGGTYHMAASMTADNVSTNTEIFVKGDLFASAMSSPAGNVRIVSRDKKTYMIMESTKMIMVTAAQDKSRTGAVDAGSLKFTGSGSAVFAGKNLPYEEYTANDNGKVQFFVDGNKLAGMRNIIPGQPAVDVVISALDQNVPDSVFTVPTSGYQVQDMSKGF